MSWQEGVAVAVVLLGLGARAFLVAQRALLLDRVWDAGFHHDRPVSTVTCERFRILTMHARTQAMSSIPVGLD